MNIPSLAIIGAGPKAFALCAYCKTLESLGWTVPKITIFEKNCIGSFWNGKNGYSDGKRTLEISPLKDVTYPSEMLPYGDAFVAQMHQYSFITFLKQTKQFTQWVDGSHSLILHGDFVEYLEWLNEQLKPNIVYSTVESLVYENNAWTVTSCVDGETERHVFDGVIPTGPGANRRTVEHPACEHIYNGRDFWTPENLSVIRQYSKPKIALIGSGISASSVFEKLYEMFGDALSIDWYSKHGLFTRSENFMNNQFFSVPDERWTNMNDRQKRGFIAATDRGTIDESVTHTMYRLRNAVSYKIGKITSIDVQNNRPVIEDQSYDLAIIATGYNPAPFLSLLPETLIEQTYGKPAQEVMDILFSDLEPDFSAPQLPGLHLPMMAFIKYGIGYSTLGCLALMSHKILASYVSAPHE